MRDARAIVVRVEFRGAREGRGGAGSQSENMSAAPTAARLLSSAMGFHRLRRVPLRPDRDREPRWV